MSSRFSNNYFPNFPSEAVSIQENFNVDINTLENGKEQRIYRGRLPSKFVIDAVKAMIYRDDVYSYETLKEHYNSMNGSFRAFRFRCKLDCYAEKERGFIGKAGMGNGYPSHQLYKFKGTFLDEGVDDFKKIVLPVDFKAYVNDVYDPNCTVDYLTGIVRFAPRKTASIYSFSKSGLNVTFNFAANHNFLINDVVYLNIKNPSNALYQKTYKVTAIEAKSITITLDEDVTVSSIGSESTIDLYPQFGETLRAEFYYDYPVRYDSVEFSYNQNGELVNFQSIVLVEVFDDLSIV